MKSENLSKTAKDDGLGGVSFSSIAISLALVLLTILAIALFGQFALPGPASCGFMSFSGDTALWVGVGLNLLNLGLLAYLLAQYTDLYWQLHSEFTLGLIILAYVLLAHSIMASPALFEVMAGRGMMGGSFQFLPAIFTFIAASVLLYLNSR
ncbi:MAG: hypothetical protein V1728_04485 [Candidatus Micrarchaeota archaeon]